MVDPGSSNEQQPEPRREARRSIPTIALTGLATFCGYLGQSWYLVPLLIIILALFEYQRLNRRQEVRVGMLLPVLLISSIGALIAFSAGRLARQLLD